jgi:hypothetical protein
MSDLERRLSELSRRSEALAREVAEVAAQARAFAIGASLAAAHGEPAHGGPAEQLEHVGGVAYEAEACVRRAAALIGECRAITAGETGSEDHAGTCLVRAIAELHAFSNGVCELERALERQLASVPGAVRRASDRPTLRFAFTPVGDGPDKRGS